MSEIQSIHIPINKYTKKEAWDWILQHGFTPIKETKESNYYKFRLDDPKYYKRFRTKVLDNGIQLILGFY